MKSDPVLRVKCKKVNEISPRIKRLIEDMFDTMYELNESALQRPKSGIVRRIVVMRRLQRCKIRTDKSIYSQRNRRTGVKGRMSQYSRILRLCKKTV